MPAPTSIELIADLATRHYGQHISAQDLVPIMQGASGRCITRLPGKCIGIFWTDERADNMAFIPAAEHMHTAGIRAPRIITHATISPHAEAALVEDMGDVSLLTLKDRLWEERKPLYIKTLKELHRLHASSPSFELQPPFDINLYCWEQRYFAEHFIKDHLKISPYSFIRHPINIQQAKELAALPMRPIHRDFQSQNVHIVDGETYLIDFQGMRMGLPEYDLASLVYDPYAGLTGDQQHDLIAAWEDITHTPLDRAVFEDCAIQRLMQAIGAFAKLSHAGNAWYTEYITPALKSLSRLAENSLFNIPLRPILDASLL